MQTTVRCQRDRIGEESARWRFFRSVYLCVVSPFATAFLKGQLNSYATSSYGITIKLMLSIIIICRLIDLALKSYSAQQIEPDDNEAKSCDF